MKKVICKILVLALLLQLCGCAEVFPESAEKTTEVSVSESRSVSESEALEIHYINVGQGDAALIKQGEHAMLIDAGNNDRGEEVLSYLKSQNIEKLEYVIGTHPDADHVGGLDTVMGAMECGTIILPDFEKDTITYKEVLQEAADKQKQITYPNIGDEYSLGEAEFTVVTPGAEIKLDGANNNSAGILLSFGDTKFLFTGDAEEEAEGQMLSENMELSADVFKLAHHGSDTANTAEFLTRVNPEYVVISCGEDNSYGHPHAAVLNELRAMGILVYRTDQQGTIVASSDGNQISWNCSPDESWLAGEPKGSSQGVALEERLPEEAKAYTYVLNHNTMKFHVLSCDSVMQMKESNKEYSTSNPQELEEEGYEPCKNCNP